MDYLKKLIGDIEIHSVEGIKECFENGISPNDLFDDKPLIYELTSEYARTPRFKECVRVFIDHGLAFYDQALLAVFSDDAGMLEAQLMNDKTLINARYYLRCAYTPLFEVTLLHICAEYNLLACAKVLVKYGCDINARAGVDEYGFGGQTPIFHTVNQNSNNSAEMLDYLLFLSVDLKLTVTGLVWGKGYEWETLIPAVNPISYAMMGLLPQMHRSELVISKVIGKLLESEFGIQYPFPNTPCKYLK